MSRKKYLNRFPVVFLVLLFAAMAALSCGGQQWNIHNPYENVDWRNHPQFKGNFHTHTTQSDGGSSPEVVIDRYAEIGYSILSLTDHDTIGPRVNGQIDRENPDRWKTTWPWQAWDRDPSALGMIAVHGNEISRRHHIGSYFNDYGDPDIPSEEAAIEEIGRRGGIAMLFHPGRYDRTVEWYVDTYRSYPHLVGLEIYNAGNRYPNDRELWDAILTEIIEERPVWGYSNDDMHGFSRLGHNWNVFILPELTEEWVRRGMENGIFFYVWAPKGHSGPSPPEISSVDVNRRRGTISIQATGYERIEWISEGNLIHEGNSIRISEIEGVGKYVRAVLHGDGGIVMGTQPFRIESTR